MNNSSGNPPAESFFLKTEFGDCFCLYHTPHPDKKCLGGFIYVHPFGEEMNKSRRMVALQARVFAAILVLSVLAMGLFVAVVAAEKWSLRKYPATAMHVKGLGES